jgi:hypothetical protein
MGQSASTRTNSHPEVQPTQALQLDTGTPQSLGEVANAASPVAGWDISHYEPPRWKCDTDIKEQLSLQSDNVFEKQHQSHGRLPTTGVKVTIEDAGQRDKPFYQTQLELRLNDASLHQRRLVKTSSLKEALAWAARTLKAVLNTPAKWVLVNPGGVALARWSTFDGTTHISLYQEDRDYPEPREYYVMKVKEPNRYRPRRQRVASGLETADLFGAVTEHLVDGGNDTF